MKTRLAISVVLALLAAPLLGADDETGFVSLFDGKTLDGWEGNLKVFRVEEGAIVAGSLKEKVPNNEFLCTKKEYGDFELRLQAKLVGKGENAGVQFRSQRIPNHYEVVGYQFDMGSAGERSIWGSLYDESRRKKFLVDGDSDALRKVLRPDDWNDVVIRCEGPLIQLWVNTLQTVDYRELEKDIAAKGIIGLQIHGGEPAQASYRKIRIKELGKKDEGRGGNDE
jgi:hypothetical protein